MYRPRSIPSHTCLFGDVELMEEHSSKLSLSLPKVGVPGCLNNHPLAEPALAHPTSAKTQQRALRTGTYLSYHSSHWQYTDTSGLKVFAGPYHLPQVATIYATSPIHQLSSTARPTLDAPRQQAAPDTALLACLTSLHPPARPSKTTHALPPTRTANPDCCESPIVRKNHWRQKPGRVYVSARGIRQARQERAPGRWWRQATARSRRHGSSHSK